MSASVAIAPGPPALVTIESRFPFGRGCLARISAISNRSEIVCTRNTPQRRKAAFKTSSLPVKAPVCEAAAFAAASVCPTLRTMMGLSIATSRAADRNAWASPIDSIYKTMLCVWGSSPKYSIRSPQPTSNIEPMETKALNPTFSPKLQSKIEVQSAPL